MHAPARFCVSHVFAMGWFYGCHCLGEHDIIRGKKSSKAARACIFRNSGPATAEWFLALPGPGAVHVRGVSGVPRSAACGSLLSDTYAGYVCD